MSEKVITDDFVQKPDIEIPDIEVTEEEAAKYYGTKQSGRPVRAKAEKIKAINQEKRLTTVRKTPKGIVQTPKIDIFLEEFLANGGNATEAALKVFNCTSRVSAANTGHKYLQKAKGMARLYLEKKGYGYGKLLEVAAAKMEESKTPEWWDRLMKLAEYEDFLSKKTAAPVSVNVFQAHKKFASEYVEGEIEEAEPVEEEE